MAAPAPAPLPAGLPRALPPCVGPGGTSVAPGERQCAARAAQSFNGRCPTSNRLGACVCVGFPDFIWALLFAQESEQSFQERLVLALQPLGTTSSDLALMSRAFAIVKRAPQAPYDPGKALG